jgi:DNA topoisomerase IA
VKDTTGPNFSTSLLRRYWLAWVQGEALVMGYDGMGYELWKPFLRAGMERDMKLVGEGAKSKAEVLHTSLQAMRQMFSDVRHARRHLESRIVITSGHVFCDFLRG